MPAARRSKARRPTAARRPPVDPVWEIALDQIEMEIKTLPPKLRQGSASWLRSARKTIRDAEKALGGTVTPRRARATRSFPLGLGPCPAPYHRAVLPARQARPATFPLAP